MKEIELLKIIFKDSPDILEPLNEIGKEIERLQAELDKTRLSELDKEYTIDSNIKSYNKLAKYSAELEDRIDKAIEYIEEHELNGNKISEMLCGSEIVELLEILKGSDKE